MAELSSLRNHFYFGNYSQCITECNYLINNSTSQYHTEIKYYLFRCYFALKKYSNINQQISEKDPPELQCLKIFSKYINSEKDLREMVISELNNFLQPTHNKNTKIIASLIYLHQNMHKEALEIVHDEDDLDMMAVSIQILLSLNRIQVDLAQKKLILMQEKDDDDIITQLSSAYVLNAQGGKDQETYFILQELVEKYGSSSTICCMLGVCQMGQVNFSDALELFKESIELSQSQNEKPLDEALYNIIVCLKHSNNQDKIPEYENLLKQNNPQHFYFQTIEAVSQIFQK